MARKSKNSRKTVKETVYAYPSRYGSHQSMVVQESEGDWVVCEDERGFYATTKKDLDSGLADGYRNSSLHFRRKTLNDTFPDGVVTDG